MRAAWPRLMPWKPIPAPTKEEDAAVRRSFGRRARFLLDENLDPSLAQVLRDQGYNVRTREDAGLAGRSDGEYFQAARLDGRVLLTQDADFWDDRRFPIDHQPGVFVLSAYSTTEATLDVLHVIANVLGRLGGLVEESKVRIGVGGHVTVRTREHNGRIRETRYLLDRRGSTLVWED